PTAGGFIGVLSALIIMVTGGIWIGRMVKQAVNNGEEFSLPYKPSSNDETAAAIEEPSDEEVSVKKNLPNVIVSFIPLVMVIVLLNILSQFMNPTAALLVALT